MPPTDADEVLYAPQRQDAIAADLAAAGRVSVRSLADRFGVAAETIRRDLDALVDRGVAERVHGGAVPVRAARLASSAESGLTARSTEAAAAKESIARAALELVPDGPAAVLLDAGTSTGALAALLPPREELTVITNSVPIAAGVSASHPGVVSLVGGQVRGLTQACVGGQSVATLSRLRADVVFVGTNGASAAHGLSTPDVAEGHTKRALVGAARRVVALVDARKFGQEYLMQFATWEQVDTVVTDAQPAPELAAVLHAAGTRLVVAP